MKFLDKFVDWLNEGIEPKREMPVMEKRVMNIFTLIPAEKTAYQRDVEEFDKVFDSLHLWGE